jgi:hypothetical protein
VPLALFPAGNYASRRRIFYTKVAKSAKACTYSSSLSLRPSVKFGSGSAGLGYTSTVPSQILLFLLCFPVHLIVWEKRFILLHRLSRRAGQRDPPANKGNWKHQNDGRFSHHAFFFSFFFFDRSPSSFLPRTLPPTGAAGCGSIALCCSINCLYSGLPARLVHSWGSLVQS